MKEISLWIETHAHAIHRYIPFNSTCLVCLYFVPCRFFRGFVLSTLIQGGTYTSQRGLHNQKQLGCFLAACCCPLSNSYAHHHLRLNGCCWYTHHDSVPSIYRGKQWFPHLLVSALHFSRNLVSASQSGPLKSCMLHLG